MLFVLSLAISLLVFLTGYLSALGKLHDARRKFFNRPTVRGWTVIFLGLVTLGMGGIQFNLNETIQTQRDSLSDQRLKENTTLIVETFSKSLAEYGLKYDSAQKRIERLVRDSANRVTTIINANEPDLDFCVNGIEISRKVFDDDKSTPDSLTFKINLCSKIASAYNIKVRARVIAVASDDENYFFAELLSDPFKLPIDQSISFHRRFDLNGNARIDWILVLLTGTYTEKPRGGKTIPLYSLRNFSFKTNVFGMVNNPNEQAIPAFTNQKEWKKLHHVAGTR